MQGKAKEAQETLFENIKSLLQKKREGGTIEEKEVISASLSINQKSLGPEEDIDDYDEIDEPFVIRPNKWTLSFNTIAKYKESSFLEYVYDKTKTFHRRAILVLFLVYLLQTVFMIIVRDYFDNDLAILILRFVFLALFAIYAILTQFFSKKIKGYIMFLCTFTLGFVSTMVQAASTEIAIFQRIQLIELVFIYVISTQAR